MHIFKCVNSRECYITESVQHLMISICFIFNGQHLSWSAIWFSQVVKRKTTASIFAAIQWSSAAYIIIGWKMYVYVSENVARYTKFFFLAHVVSLVSYILSNYILFSWTFCHVKYPYAPCIYGKTKTKLQPLAESHCIKWCRITMPYLIWSRSLALFTIYTANKNEGIFCMYVNINQ